MASRSDSSPYLYREIQYFRQIWLWALVLFISLLSLYGAFQQLILGKPFGNNPAPDSVMVILVIIFGVALPWGPQKTMEGRRVRLNAALSERLEPHGWRSLNMGWWEKSK